MRDDIYYLPFVGIVLDNQLRNHLPAGLFAFIYFAAFGLGVSFTFKIDKLCDNFSGGFRVRHLFSRKKSNASVE